MNKHEARLAIRSKASVGAVIFSTHAEDEMLECDASTLDVLEALSNCTSCFRQENGTWYARGPSLEGVELAIIVEILESLIVVTVFEYGK